MAKQITFVPSTSPANTNTNFQRVNEALEDVLSRSGELPNHINADLDMNSNDILNVKSIEADSFIIEGIDFNETITKVSEEANKAEAAADKAVAHAEQAKQSALEAANAGGAAGSLFGLTLSNNSTDPDNDIDILSGSCRDIGNTVNMALGTTITKRLDASWAQGSGNGGLDTGSKANSTGYHVWLIRRSDTGVVDALFSTSATNPSMPANYDQKRRLGAILTDGSGNIRPFVQTGGWFMLKTPFAMLPATTANNLSVLRSLAVPLGVKLRLKLVVQFNSPTNTCYFSVKDPDEGAATIGDFEAYSPAAGQNAVYSPEVFCNTSGQIYTYAHRTDAVIISSNIRGWYDIRDTSV